MKRFSTICLCILVSTVSTKYVARDQFPQPLVAALGFQQPHSAFYTVHPDTHLTTVQLIKKYGYVGETHEVTTEDGYILQVHRVTGPRKNPKPDAKPVVFIMHGLLTSSSDWVIAGPEKGLAYILADEGYDVWLGNARGTTYSGKHVSTAISDKDYWSFSWHEIGTRDLPAMIDHVIETTGKQKIFYMGHSQGTTAFFVMASQLPYYQEKITAMFAMAPIAYVSRMISPPFRLLAKYADNIAGLMSLIGKYEFKPTDKGFKYFSTLVCDEELITHPICSNVCFLISGFSYDQLNKTLLATIMGHVPAGASVKQFQHYAQLIKSGHFRQYDYGLIGNLKKYRRTTPPSYDLGSIRVPVALHYSSNDWLADVKDVNQLYQELGNPIGKFRVPHNQFNHLDYMWANDVKGLVYTKIISLLSRYKD